MAQNASGVYSTFTFDYTGLQYKATIVDYNADSLDSTNAGRVKNFYIASPNGEVYADSAVANFGNSTGVYQGHAFNVYSAAMGISGNHFGTDVRNTDAAGSVSGLAASLPWTHWRFSDEVEAGVRDQWENYETGLAQNTYVFPKIDDLYSGIPVIVTRGDAVLHAFVDSISGNNFLAVNNESETTTIPSHDYAGAKGEVLDGGFAGEIFHVVSTGWFGGNLILEIDRDAKTVSEGYSGAIIALYPRAVIVGYSGWESMSTSTTLTTTGEGITAQFNLDSAIPENVGSWTGANPTVNGTVQFDSSPLLFGVPSVSTEGEVNGTSINITNYIDDLRDARVGDLFYYDALAGGRSGAVITEATDVGAGIFQVTFYPQGTFAAGAEYEVYRVNEYKIEAYPEFDKTYLGVVHTGVSDEDGNPSTILDASLVSAPEASLEFSANDYEASYGTVTERSHFHIGPVNLSNGQRLDHSEDLYMTASLYDGDPLNSTPMETWEAYSTQNPDIGENFDGLYYRDGVFVGTLNQAFNAAETLTLVAEVRLGSANIRRVITLPVQPSI
jgi:hypothetical protein